MVIHFLRYSTCDKYGRNQGIIFKITELLVILHHSGSTLTCFLTKLCSTENVYSLFLTKSFYTEYAHIWALLVAQMVKIRPATRETRVWSLGGEDPLEKGMATHSSILAWRILWAEKPCGLPSLGSQRVRHGWTTSAHTHTHTHTRAHFWLRQNLRCKAFKDKIRKVWWRMRQNQTWLYESRKRTQMA